MALKIIREIPFGPGSKGFRFGNQEDITADQEQYEEGRALEESCFQEGSLAQRVYERLSSVKRAA